MQKRLLGLVLGASMVLASCDWWHEKPSAQQAQAAIGAWAMEAGLQNLPAGFSIDKVVMSDCTWQEAPAGQLCNVVLISKAVPILGAVSVPLKLRFVQSEGTWRAFMF